MTPTALPAVRDPITLLSDIVFAILPPGEAFDIRETTPSPGFITYTIVADTTRARAILIGSGGETVNALRRIFSIASYGFGRRITIEVERSNVNEQSVAR